ncbi:hypothetical protein [Veillonella agrestimuris]|uniref:hypothetical protein n=1 Tax=Veillonella agrestimuris TaxID=2941340 RepID=UPI00203D47E3|nr:hypothetical protein [Veillonella agrestimuris]
MEQYSKEIPTVDIIALHNYLYEESYDEHEEGNYLCYLIPTYESGGDSTYCYYLNGRNMLINKSIKTVLRRLTEAEGLQSESMLSMTGTKPMYTDPRTYGPHMTFAYLKVRQPIGRSSVYGMFNVILPHAYKLRSGPTKDTCFIQYDAFDPILIYHSLHRAKRKIQEAKEEHRCYLERWFRYLTMTSNKTAIAELVAAWHSLSDLRR